jgi:prepilin peptidase CpaA
VTDEGVAPSAFEAAHPAPATPEAPRRVDALHAGPVGASIAASAAALLLVGAGWVAEALSPAYAVAVVFLALVVQQDTRHRKIPNALTGTGLLVAIGLHAWQGGLGAAGTALVHALVPFALLILPFAMGVIGAGDVKAFMVLGGLFGSATTLALIVYSAVISGVVAFVWLWSQGELWLLFERAFMRMRAGLRRVEEPQALPGGRAIGSALPLGAAIAGSLAVRVLVERFA